MNKIKKVVHFDLNGMTPSFDHFLELIPIFADAGYDTLMLGWEDRFPWKEKGFRSKVAFSEEEILKIQYKAIECGMDFISMIQILGHLENFLALEKFNHLREVPDRSDCLNPLAPGALSFILNLLDEVLALSPTECTKYIHLGGDEVWTMGSHPDTKEFIKNNSKAKLYIKHLCPIIEKLKSRGIRPLLWHDMLIKWDDEELLSIKDDVDIVFWKYEGVIDETIKDENRQDIKRFSKLGFNIWGSGAFKGGSGCASIMPDIKELSRNATSWYNVSQEYDFQGLVATGWGRYSQFHPPCDPIYSSFESLYIIGSIFDGELDHSSAIKKMDNCLDKYGLKNECDNIKKISIEFSGTYSRSWACIHNLHQQYIMEDEFLKGEKSHLSKVMFDQFCNEVDILKKTAIKLKAALQPFIDENDISQFIDTKVFAVERLLEQSKNNKFS